jgi:hypothetical protein
MGEVSYRVSSQTRGLMLAFAGLVDGAQVMLVLIPGIGIVLNFILGIFAVMVLGVWFFLLGVSYFGGSKAGTKIISMLAAVVIEAVPLIDALPATVIGVACIISASRKEDEEKAVAQNAAA